MLTARMRKDKRKQSEFRYYYFTEVRNYRATNIKLAISYAMQYIFKIDSTSYCIIYCNFSPTKYFSKSKINFYLNAVWLKEFHMRIQSGGGKLICITAFQLFNYSSTCSLTKPNYRKQ